MKRKLFIVLIALPIIFIIAFLKEENSRLGNKLKTCGELVKAYDHLMLEVTTDYKDMSGIAVKHVNSQQLNYADPATYDKLKDNYKVLENQYTNLAKKYQSNCE